MLASSATLALIAGYLCLLLDLPREQWVYLLRVCGVVFLIALVMFHLIFRYRSSELLAFLKAEETGEASSELLRSGFSRLSSLPVDMFVAGGACWLIGGVLAASGAAIRFDSFGCFAIAVVALAAATGGFVFCLLVYALERHAFRDLLGELRRRISAPAELRVLAKRASVKGKLMVCVTGLTLLVTAFSLSFSTADSNRRFRSNTAKSQLAHLKEWAPELSAGGAEALAAGTARAQRLGLASDLLLLDSETGEVIWGPADLLCSDELRAVLTSPDGGDNRGSDSPNLLAWLRLGEAGPVVVAAQPRREVVAGWRDLSLRIAVTLLLAVGSAVVLSRQLSSDTSRAITQLAEATDRVARGSLQRFEVVQCDDEVGDLVDRFGCMVDRSRSGVARLAEVSDRLEAAAKQTNQACEQLSRGAEGRSQGMAQTATSMEQASLQVTGIADSAQHLNLLVEESSSSMLEMGATSEELSDTATVLSSKVNDVFVSIEQMTRSVGDAGSNADALSDVAGETSSSMEEMARSMRQVDHTAGETAKLCQKAVGAAESGCDRVRQTIESIESIRQATVSAERVIQGLGNRAKAIGSILDVIDDVADETNLLALNAAIIAAQAGERGRAFSVVAEEIKKLADRVLSNTREIGDVIRAVQSESENAVGAMAEGSRSVARGVELSTQAGVSLEEITRTSREAEGRMREIVMAVQEQTKASDHVVEMMGRVQGGVEGIQRASEEQVRGHQVIYNSSITMRDVAQQLRSTTEEQARGATRIAQSMDGVRGAVENINEALQLQSTACREVTTLLAEISGGARTDDESIDRMLREATRSLLAQAEDVRRFVSAFEL